MPQPREEPSPQELRDAQRSRLLASICELQAALAEFDAASETAGAIAVDDVRRRSQGRVPYWMAREGRSQLALERALALDAPEPRLGALVQVAQACEGILTERKEKEKKEK
jgi:hypothetical protein